tara:strand:- start:10918 stop:11955 length:1038 start_codon:yes stop_codon:yes gene_type:complete
MIKNKKLLVNKFKDKIVLITGGTGSFGKQFLHYLLKKKIKEIRIFSRDELKQHDLRNSLNNNKVTFYLGDVRNINSVDHAMNDVDYVFHAAALKQVPSCEFFPNEAVLTNVIGSANVIKSSIEHKVKSFVGLSTDKAVYPINVMGMTKALMEKTVLNFAKQKNLKTKINIVRYGNVMLSRGSVIPLFVSQIRNNQKVTITDKNMTRFLLPLDQAVELVAHALTNGKTGEILIKKSISANIFDLVKILEKILNKKANINYIGLRHGEKINEVLASKDEMQKSIASNKYITIPIDRRDLNYNQYFTKGDKIRTKKFNDYSSDQYLIKDKNKLLKIISFELKKHNLID